MTPEQQQQRCREYYQKNRSKILAQKREARQKNPEKFRSRHRKWARENPEKIREAEQRRDKDRRSAYNQEYYQQRREEILEQKKAAYKDDPSKSLARVALRRAALSQAIPSWLTDEDWDKITAIYEEARSRTETTGIAHEVDHVVPLRGRHVSGLHCPANLQVIPATANRRKGNKHG